jgi:hypothetical protein
MPRISVALEAPLPLVYRDAFDNGSDMDENWQHHVMLT